MRRALVALVVVAAACGPSERGKRGPTVEWHETQSLTAADQALVLEAWNHHRKTWAFDNGAPAPQVAVVEFWGGPTINKPGAPAGCDGITWPGERRIAVVVGRLLEVPAAYHELTHLSVIDEFHQDPRWATWDRAQDASISSLLAARRTP